MKASRFLLLILLTITLSITACSQQAPTVEGEEDIVLEELEPLEGGTLRLSVTRFTNFNPLVNNNKTLYQIQNLIYEGLVGFDEARDIKPVLAESWKISTDGQSIDFTLRNDVNWHDGTAFTADDVIFTLQLIKSNNQMNGTSIYRASLQNISDMRVVEGNVLRVTFTRPFSNGLEVLTFPILPKHLFQGSNANLLKEGDFPMVGTGIYKVAEYERMQQISLVKNDAYWGQKPFIDNVSIVIVPDKEAQLSLFENGEIDVAQPVAVDWAKYTDGKNEKVYEYISNQYEFLGFNFKNTALTDKIVRQAFAYAIDRHKIVKNLYLGHGTVVDVPVQPNSWLFDDERITYGYDIAKANTILDDNGYVKNDKNIRVAPESNTPLRFKLITNKDNLLREKTAYQIKDELQQIGIEIDIQLLAWNDFNQQLAQGNFDIALAGWELSDAPDMSFAFHSSQPKTTNFISYANDEMNVILENIFKSPTRNQKLANYKLLQQHITDELPYLSLFYKNSAIAVRSTIKGNFHPQPENHFNGIAEWFINSKPKEKESE